MAAPTRTIRVKFDGSAKGLERAAKDGERAVDNMQRNLDRKAGGFAAIGAKIGVKLGDGMMSVLGTLPVSPKLAIIGAAIGAAMAPAIGAAVSAGVLLAVGGGVLAAGIFAAAKDPQVSAAWAAFGERAKKALAGFAEPFKGPMIRAAGTFGDSIERMAPQLKQLGTILAPVIDKLAPALATMAEKAMPGIAAAAVASKPLFDVLAKHAPRIGDAVSTMLQAISIGAPGAAAVLDMMLTSLEMWLVALGVTFAILSVAFARLRQGWDVLWAAVVTGFKATQNAAGAAKDWIVGRWNDLVGFFSGLPARISNAVGGMWDGVKNAFRAALNWIIDKWNNFRIPGVSVAGVQVSPQVDFPDLPRLQHGGPALAGRDYLVGEAGPEILRMGSQSGTVIPNHAIGGPDVLNLTLDLGHGIQQVVTVNLRERDRGLKRRAMAGAGAR